MDEKKKVCKLALLMVLIGSMLIGCTAPMATPLPAPKAEIAPTPTALAASKPAPKIETVKVQIPAKAATLLTFYLGPEKGLYREEGIDMTVGMVLPIPGIIISALLAGEVDYLTGANALLHGGMKGLPIKLLMAVRTKAVWHLYGGEGINSAADLKGKSVGVAAIGDASHYVTKETIRFLGLDPEKDVTYVVVRTGPEQVAALKAKAVAAIALAPPLNLIAREEGFKELAFSGDIMDHPTNGFGTTDKRIKENPDQVKRAIRGTLKSIAYQKDHPAEAVDLLVKQFGVDQKVAKEVNDFLVKTLSPDGSITPKALQSLVGEGKASGALTGKEPLEKGYDFNLLKEAQKELKLAP